jgi:hypothetical protein
MIAVIVRSSCGTGKLLGTEQSSATDALTTREEPLVKIYVDTTGITFTVAKKAQPKVDEKGNQKSERGTGRPYVFSSGSRAVRLAVCV